MYDYFMEKFVYQMFILGCENYDFALQKGLGGVIFFTKDIQTQEQFRDLISDIKSKSLISPFLSIDQEGGRVERTENIIPKRLSARIAYKKGADFLIKQYENIYKELSDFGINLNFAPCIDVNTNEKNPIIGERAFGNNPNDVIDGMNIVMKIAKKYNIISCVKHFPGHGDADKDSHLELPQIKLTFKEMEKTHILPFKVAVENGVEMIMAAHLHCTCFDSEILPSSLSKNALGYLRNKLNYNGVIISDDMVMKGVEKYGSLEACIMGINAGIDMFIFRHSDEQTYEIINQLIKVVERDKNLQEKVLQSYDRILRLKQNYNII